MYSFGCVMFETLTGEAPFNAESPTQIMYMHMTEPIPPLEIPEGEVPDIIPMIINKTLAKDPADRFMNMKELTDALLYAQKEVTGSGSSARPR
jgi:serine/threonine-protein kinase